MIDEQSMLSSIILAVTGQNVRECIQRRKIAKKYGVGYQFSVSHGSHGDGKPKDGEE
jgi:hypothetical protein